MDSKITVGVPAYNEEKNISATLDALLIQDYENVEIIVSDNCSTDGTVGIVRDYIKRHSNIQLVQQPTNLGSLENFNSLIRRANSEYFMFMGSHDLISENYISSLIRCLESNENSVLAFGKTTWIDYSGKELRNLTSYVDTSGLSPITRFNLTFWSNQNAIYGVFRLGFLKKTRLQLPVFAPGGIMLCELSLLGDFVLDMEAIWYRRESRSVEPREIQLSRYYRNLFTKPRLRILPFTVLLFAYLSIPFVSTTLSARKRITLFFNILFSYLFRFGGEMLMSDPLSLLRRLIKLKL